MDPSQDARDRIFKAADALYDQAGREVFPTVDAVRKAAKVNMNEASTVMKEWRRTQARPAPAAIQVPETVQLAGDYFTCTGQNSAIYSGKSAAENLIAQHTR